MVCSWSDYLTTVLFIILFYYSVMVLIFFRKDVILKLRPTKMPAGNFPAKKEPAAKEAGASNTLDAASAAPMHQLVDELQAYVTQAGQQGTNKNDLSQGIKKLLQKYPAMYGSTFQEGITNLIAVISENECAVHFSVDELRELWKT